MGEFPDPLTPADCDLRGLPFMPMDVVRILDSDLFALSTGDEFKAALALWCKAWLQIPAASLPDDDRVLAHLSGAGGKWKKIREAALRNWIKCSDGRFYHPTVAEKAIDAWERRGDWQEKQNNKTERQQRWRDHVKAVSAELRTLGVTPPSNASLKELERLLVDAKASTLPSTVDAAEAAKTGTGTGTGTVRLKAQPSPTIIDESPKPSLAREEPPEDITWTGELALNYVCQAAGWWPGDNHRGAAIGTINGWLQAGCSMKLILAGIGLALKRNPQPTKSLKRFDSTIRGMRRDQLGGELPHTEADVQAMTSGLAKRLSASG